MNTPIFVPWGPRRLDLTAEQVTTLLDLIVADPYPTVTDVRAYADRVGAPLSVADAHYVLHVCETCSDRHGAARSGRGHFDVAVLHAELRRHGVGSYWELAAARRAGEVRE
ncbi:MAG: hypothetical protein IRZ28_20845 [Steroidobacteraceae bacterium]|nr:hypothetical protein [Steroidobacteraceae bacterium]